MVPRLRDCDDALDTEKRICEADYLSELEEADKKYSTCKKKWVDAAAILVLGCPFSGVPMEVCIEDKTRKIAEKMIAECGSLRATEKQKRKAENDKQACLLKPIKEHNTCIINAGESIGACHNDVNKKHSECNNGCTPSAWRW
jgi:hypothetical protein